MKTEMDWNDNLENLKVPRDIAGVNLAEFVETIRRIKSAILEIRAVLDENLYPPV